MPNTYRSMGLYIQLPKTSSMMQTVKTTVCHLNYCSSFLVDKGYFGKNSYVSSVYKLNGILKIGWLWVICFIRNEKGTGAEMYPAILSGIVSGSASVSYWPVFSSISSNSPRSRCESWLGVVSFSLVNECESIL